MDMNQTTFDILADNPTYDSINEPLRRISIGMIMNVGPEFVWGLKLHDSTKLQKHSDTLFEAIAAITEEAMADGYKNIQII